jgi:hypothetical protein
VSYTLVLIELKVLIHLLIVVFRVFVNARPRPVIIQNMRERIERGDIEAERTEAIQVSSTNSNFLLPLTSRAVD